MSGDTGDCCKSCAEVNELNRGDMEYLADFVTCNSCAREEERRQADQVQGPLQP